MGRLAMRRHDLHSANELRARLERAGGSEWVDLSALRTWFGGRRLSRARKRQIAAALAAARVDVYPPLLGLRGPEKVRLEALADPATQSGWRQRIRKAWQPLRARLFTPLGVAISLTASLVSIGGAIAALTPDEPAQLPRMSGDLNVAVAPFTTNGSVTEEGVALGRDAAQALRAELPRLDRSLQIEVRGPDTVAPVSGSNGASQARVAGEAAQANGADIVVYGELATGPLHTSLQPAFYLNAAKLPSASALGGKYGYGGTISLPYSLAVSPPARAQIRAALVRRTEAYAQAFIGVGYYLLHAFPGAERHLRHALQGAPNPSVAALLRLLLGNVAGQQGHPAAAAHYYLLSSRDSSTRRRAQLGLADVGYEVAHGHCRRGETSARKLSAVRQRFAVVLHALGGMSAARSGSRLAAKAAFGEGQVDLCLSAAQAAQRWHAARREFAATIDAYHASVPELRDDAAEAHAGIGLCDLSIEKPPRAYADARREYEVAAQLTTIASRRAYFDGAIGFADSQLGRYSSALHMYEEGARLAGATALGHSLSGRARQLASKAEAGE